MVSASIGREHYNTQLITSHHQLIADEPEDVGGKNAGPSPDEYLRSSLAACTAITLRMYIDRKQWNVENIRVEINSTKEGNTTVFNREIFIQGEINEEQHARLLQIANACPIHKILTNPIEVKTQLK